MPQKRPNNNDVEDTRTLHVDIEKFLCAPLIRFFFFHIKRRVTRKCSFLLNISKLIKKT